MKTVQGVLGLLRTRLSQAERRLAAARAQEQSCIEERERKQSSLMQFRIHAKEEERAMFQRVIGQQIQLSTFDDLNAAVATLKSRCEAMEQAVLEAEERVSQAQQQTAGARVEVAAHNARTQKYVQWSDQLAHEDRLAIEHAEENEIEDMVVLNTSRLPASQDVSGQRTSCRKSNP